MSKASDTPEHFDLINPCPVCGAKENKLCTTKTGKLVLGGFHKKRWFDPSLSIENVTIPKM